MRPSPRLKRLHPAPLAVAAAVVLTAPLQGQAQQPIFRSGVDLIRLDVLVVTADGTPVTDLTERDFDIQVNGTPSPVRTLRFLDLTATETPAIELTSADVSTNAATTRGRLTVIVIDEDNLPDDTRPLMEGLRTYLKGLGPSDQAALVVLPRPGIWQDFTHDMRALQTLLKRSSSRADRDVNRNAMTSSIPTAGIPDDPMDMKFRVASGDVASDRGEFAAPLFNPQSAADPNRDLIYALRELARRLRSVEGPKTLLLVSAGLPESITLDDYHGFADEAARARLTVYVLKPPALNATASSNTSALEKQFQAQNGLDFVAGMTGGVVLNAVGGAHGVFERITRETSGSYVIGVEPPPGAPRNTPLAVTVKVKRDGLTVRSPRQVATAAAGLRKLAASPKETLGSLLHDPRVATDVPLRVTSYTARGIDAGRVKTLIVAELDSPGADEAVWGFEIHGASRVISDAFDTVSLKALAGEPMVTSASLPPGKYTLRLGFVDDQGRRASVDRPLTLGLHQAGAGDLQFSDVLAGVAVGGHFKPRISVDTSAGHVIALLEVYGAPAATFDNVAIEFALRRADGTNHAVTRARVQAAASSGVSKGIAQGALALGQAVPGRYTVTAALLVNGTPAGVTQRELVVGPSR
jgi:VWFA-related protein